MTPCTPESTPLEFHGGPVVRSPQIYLIFWGSNWLTTEEGQRWHGHVLNTLGGLTEEYGLNLTYQHILGQYWDNTGPIENVKLAGEYVYQGVTAPQGQEREDIKSQVEAAIATNHWAQTSNSIFVVLHPPGTVYQEVFATEKASGCGFHESDHQGDIFAFVPDFENRFFSAKCGGYAESEGVPLYNRIVTFSASHEYTEATTDPKLTAWFDSEGREIGDICAEHGPISPGAHQEALGIWLTSIWGNHEAAEKGQNEGCVIKDPPEPAPPAPTAVTGAASSSEPHSATFEGTVTPNGPDAHYYIEYGTTTSYGAQYPAAPGGDAGSGTSAVPVAVTIGGLARGTLYHYRLVASTWVGVTKGADQVVRTSPWEAQTTPSSPHVNDVSCVSATFCVAAGETSVSKPAVMSWNGTVWTEVTVPAPKLAKQSELQHISCASATACVAIGSEYLGKSTYAPFPETFNGKAWELQTLSTPSRTQIEDVSCPSAKYCVAIGFYIGTNGDAIPLAFKWDGSKWTSYPVPVTEGAYSSSLSGVSCSGTTACTAVGSSTSGNAQTSPMAVRWNGSAWSLQVTHGVENSTEQGIYHVSCAATTACTAIGSATLQPGNTRQYFAENWNGSSWGPATALTLPPAFLSGLYDVSCFSASSCTAVGSYTTTSQGPQVGIAEHWDGANWSRQVIPGPAGAVRTAPSAVSCWAAASCTAIGFYEGEPSGSRPLAEASLESSE